MLHLGLAVEWPPFYLQVLGKWSCEAKKRDRLPFEWRTKRAGERRQPRPKYAGERLGGEGGVGSKNNRHIIYILWTVPCGLYHASKLLSVKIYDTRTTEVRSI